MTHWQDDRTEEQKQTHCFGIAATDKYMSDRLCNGKSVTIWAYPNRHDALQPLFDWIKAREEMKWVRYVDLRVYRPRKNVGHVHIYVTNGEVP